MLPEGFVQEKFSKSKSGIGGVRRIDIAKDLTPRWLIETLSGVISADEALEPLPLRSGLESVSSVIQMPWIAESVFGVSEIPLGLWPELVLQKADAALEGLIGEVRNRETRALGPACQHGRSRSS
jgi:hypothetical protein